MDRRRLREELLALLGDLVAIPSTYPPGDTTRIAAYCHDFLSPLGFRVEVISKAPGTQNVVARLGSGANRPIAVNVAPMRSVPR